MRKLITAMVAVITLTMSVSASIVDNGFVFEDFKYMYSPAKGKCIMTPSMLSEKLHKEYKAKNGVFLMHIPISVANIDINGQDFTNIYFIDKGICQALFEGADKSTVNYTLAIAELNVEIVKQCNVKVTFAETFTVANQLKLMGDTSLVKRAVEKAGLKCNN